MEQSPVKKVTAQESGGKGGESLKKQKNAGGGGIIYLPGTAFR